MAYATPPLPRLTPRITFSSLAELLGAPFPKAQQILKAQKYPKPGPTFGYKRAAEEAATHLVNGTQFDPLAPGLRPHESEAIAALAGAVNAILPTNATASFPSKHQPKWSIQNVDISAYPDVTLIDQSGANAGKGAMKLYMKKEPLGRSVGPAMAALLYYYQSQVLQVVNTIPSLCIIYDARAQSSYPATGNYARLIAQVQTACSMIAAVWPTL